GGGHRGVARGAHPSAGAPDLPACDPARRGGARRAGRATRAHLGTAGRRRAHALLTSGGRAMTDTTGKPPTSVPPPPGPPSFVARRIPTLPDKPLQRRVYDVAIIGPDLGGAATAALLAKRGLRVLMAPLSQGVVTRDSEGWLLPAAHPMIPPLRQLSGSIFALDELGLAADLQRQSAGTATGAFQLLGEELRLSLPADGLRRRAEPRRELGDEAPAPEAA